MDGVRLLSHRPSVLYKVEHLASEPAAGDIAVQGLLLAGPGWDERLRSVIKSLSVSERACLFAVRLAAEQARPFSPPPSPTRRACPSPPRRCWTARAPTGSRSSSPTGRCARTSSPSSS